MSGYLGWELDPSDRAALLSRYIPAYPDTVAHHVTLRLGKGDAPDAVEAAIVGYANDGLGCEALVVSINGETERPDGKTFHITWSLDRESGRRSMHSNEVLASGWIGLSEPIPITLIPRQFS